MSSLIEKHFLTRAVELTSTVSGLDKFYRLYTYLSFLIWPNRPPSYTSSISSARMVMRLLGIIGVLDDLRITAGGFKVGSSGMEKCFNAAKIYSMLVFFPAEAIHWVIGHWDRPRRESKTLEPTRSTGGESKITEKEEEEQVFAGISHSEWSTLSCRAWLVYILVDMASLIRRWCHAPASAAPDGQGARRIISLLLLYDMCDLPLAANWSLANPRLGNRVIGVFGTLGTLLMLSMQWRQTLSKVSSS